MQGKHTAFAALICEHSAKVMRPQFFQLVSWKGAGHQAITITWVIRWNHILEKQPYIFVMLNHEDTRHTLSGYPATYASITPFFPWCLRIRRAVVQLLTVIAGNLTGHLKTTWNQRCIAGRPIPCEKNRLYLFFS
jgi:hypothetical protein